MEFIDESDASSVLNAIATAISEDRLDDAERLLEQLHVLEPDSKNDLTFPVFIAIKRGQVLDMLRHINDLPDDHCPELKILCLKTLGDATWEGQAEALLEQEDHPFVRNVTRELLGMPLEAMDELDVLEEDEV